MNADGSNLIQLTNDPMDELDPVWSPDGKFIAYTRHGEGVVDIAVVSVDGGQPRVLTTNPTSDYKPAWTVVRRP